MIEKTDYDKLYLRHNCFSSYGLWNSEESTMDDVEIKRFLYNVETYENYGAVKTEMRMANTLYLYLKNKT